MIRRLLPDAYAPSVFSIDYRMLRKMGFRALIFDIDNTLVPHGESATPKIERFFRYLHRLGFQTILLTNNDQARTRRFLKNIQTDYLCDAAKPDPVGFFRAAERLNCDAKEIVCIGDQMFIDTLGANRAGLRSIHVHYTVKPNEKQIGKKRYLEYAMLGIRHFLPEQFHTLDCAVRRTEHESLTERFRKFRRGEILFCDISPACYCISERKEILLRDMQNLRAHIRFAEHQSENELPCTVWTEHGNLIKRGNGIDPVLQQNKAENIALAAKTLDGLMIRPGETFSFWHTVGNTTKRRGYKDGRILANGILMPGVGGGLCNLGNTLHLLVLHSPLTVTEVHYHSDALAPDHGKRVPMSAGTSVSYNYIDFRFRNDTDQPFQLSVKVEGEEMYAALRCLHPIPYDYAITEEGHHFEKDGDTYYRVSKIYRETTDLRTGEVTDKTLIRDNRSEVMFDPAEIPAELLTQ